MKVLLNLPSSLLGVELREALEEIGCKLETAESLSGLYRIELNEEVVRVITDKTKRFDFVLLHGNPSIAVLRQSAKQVATNIVETLNESYFNIHQSMSDTCRDLTKKIASGKIQPMEICLETPHKCRKRRQRNRSLEELPDREQLNKLFA